MHGDVDPFLRTILCWFENAIIKKIKGSSLAVEIKLKYLWIQFSNIWQRNLSGPIDTVLKS